MDTYFFYVNVTSEYLGVSTLSDVVCQRLMDIGQCSSSLVTFITPLRTC